MRKFVPVITLLATFVAASVYAEGVVVKKKLEEIIAVKREDTEEAEDEIAVLAEADAEAEQAELVLEQVVKQVVEKE